ncbi:precorrin-3B C17-methyltransferase [Mizugakiibacter sediminis]|uniref:Precorrin-3B C17-methyltransferase n=1 Tax=Mizugakiibacter sediminis TaxID=1475481 RepID=A0A0K8QND6_9GAMM|nr:hypothetical protein [Mizugakiibacter sediminis]GAP66383.1 precorrin-3B C17-methyltransferase [Mizugakiibacter sediminis]
MRAALYAATLVALSALAGCAGETTRPQNLASLYPGDVDWEKVVSVNQWAERKGATVVWVNMPRKPVEERR